MTSRCEGRAPNHYTMYYITINKIISKYFINAQNTILAFKHELDTAYRVHVEKLTFLHELDTPYRVHVEKLDFFI